MIQSIFNKSSIYWISKVFCTLILWGLSFSVQGQEVIKVDTNHTAKKATVRAAILPGLGHIYNQKYKVHPQKNNLWWKLPIVYGGMGFTAYLIHFNRTEFWFYKNERLMRLDPDYAATTTNPVSDSQLETLQEQHRLWRDYSIIGLGALYVLQMIDAKVEAHLMHFDVSDDLSLSFIPKFQIANQNSLGLGLVFSFKN